MALKPLHQLDQTMQPQSSLITLPPELILDIVEQGERAATVACSQVCRDLRRITAQSIGSYYFKCEIELHQDLSSHLYSRVQKFCKRLGDIVSAEHPRLPVTIKLIAEIDDRDTEGYEKAVSAALRKVAWALEFGIVVDLELNLEIPDSSSKIMDPLLSVIAAPAMHLRRFWLTAWIVGGKDVAKVPFHEHELHHAFGGQAPMLREVKMACYNMPTHVPAFANVRKANVDKDYAIGLRHIAKLYPQVTDLNIDAAFDDIDDESAAMPMWANLKNLRIRFTMENFKHWKDPSKFATALLQMIPSDCRVTVAVLDEEDEDEGRWWEDDGHLEDAPIAAWCTTFYETFVGVNEPAQLSCIARCSYVGYSSSAIFDVPPTMERLMIHTEVKDAWRAGLPIKTLVTKNIRRFAVTAAQIANFPLLDEPLAWTALEEFELLIDTCLPTDCNGRAPLRFDACWFLQMMVSVTSDGLAPLEAPTRIRVDGHLIRPTTTQEPANSEASTEFLQMKVSSRHGGRVAIPVPIACVEAALFVCRLIPRFGRIELVQHGVNVLEEWTEEAKEAYWTIMSPEFARQREGRRRTVERHYDGPPETGHGHPTGEPAGMAS